MGSNPSVENKASRFLNAGLVIGLALVVTGSGYVRAEPYPSAEMASVRTADENKIRELRNQELEEIKRVLGRRLSVNRKADLYVRMAETYLEAYRAEFLNEGRVHETRLAAGQNEPFIDRSNSKPYLRLGIRACEEVLRIGIKHPKLDQIYYFLGVYYDELEEEKNSVKYFQGLTEKFPESPYIGEAYRAIAESAYLHADYRKSLKYYELALPKYQGSALPRLLQKKAWSHYRLKQYEKAVATMKQAISECAKDEKFLSLRDESMRDMAVFMTESGRAEDAIAYFKQVGSGKDFYAKTLERLGAQYERNAEMGKAVQVYESLLKTNPDDEAAFRVRVKLFDLDLRRSHYATALKRIQGVAIPIGDDDTEVAAKNLRVLVRKTAVDAHEEYRKTQNKNSLAVAENFYTLYLNSFLSKDDEKKETPEIQMYLAEVKRDQGKPQDAAFLYKQVIRSKDERYAKQAAAFWMNSLAETIAKTKKDSKAEENTTYEKDFIEASDYVAENFGTKTEGLQARLNVIVAIAANPKRFEEAEGRIQKLVAAAPESPQALTAARLRAQLYSDRLPKKSEEIKGSRAAEEFLEVATEIRKNVALMLADTKLQKGALAGFLDSEETRIKIGTLVSQEKSKDFATAARGYAEFAVNEPKRDLSERAFESSIQNAVAAQDYDFATQMISKWIAKYKDSKRVFEQLRDVATSAIIRGQFEKAAYLFRVVGNRGDPDSLEIAGRLFEGSGNLTEAATDFRNYLSKFPKASDRGQVSLSLAEWYDYSKSDPEAIKYLRLCFEENNSFSAECGARLADLYARLETLPQADRMYRAVANRKQDRSPWIGYARYHLAMTLERETPTRKLSLPDDKLKRGLEERLAFLKKLNDAYQSVVEVAGPWSVAALDRLANWVIAFADEVDQIEPPKGATPQAIVGFRKGLRSVSDPLRIKAIETWKTAYQKAVERELFSPILPTIADRLADYGVPLPARAQGFRDKFRLSGQPADGGKEGRASALERVRQALAENAKNPISWIDYGNLLWGDGKPLLGKIAYERALLLNPKAAAALNNRGVLIASGVGQEDWIRVAEANEYFKQAISKDELFLAAKFNRGSILNYYRIFSKAIPYWNQVAAVAPQPDVFDGIAISEQGQGKNDAAEKMFTKGSKSGGDSDRPSVGFHQAARIYRVDPSKCVKLTDRLVDETSGFERQSVQRLNGVCKELKRSPK